MLNLSARGAVGATSDAALVAGFVISGSPGQKETVLLRGIGPSLGGFNIAGALAVPTLSLFDSSANPAVIATNTGWSNSAVQGSSAVAATLLPVTSTLMNSVGAFALTANSADCALAVTLPPGTYTIQVTGVAGGTGLAMVEVYELP